MVTSPKSFVLAATDMDPAEALVPVAERLVLLGHSVNVILQAHQPAAKACVESRLVFPGPNCRVYFSYPNRSLDPYHATMVRDADHVLVTLSSTAEWVTVEGKVFRYRLHTFKRPVFGFSGVICGHLAPIWKDAIPLFYTLFVAKKTEDLNQLQNIVEVGIDNPTLGLPAKTPAEIIVDAMLQ